MVVALGINLSKKNACEAHELYTREEIFADGNHKTNLG
jgi:hypothetical protein